MVRPQLRSSSLTANGASSSTLRAASTTAGVPARIVASLLLSRPPLVLPPLSEFEKAHHAYNKQLKTALSEPFDSTAYFAKGSQAERTFLERQQQQQPQQQQQLESSQTEPSQVSAKSEPLTSLERQRSRTLYLLLRKNRPKGGKGAWQFPQGAVETSDASLVDAATRELYEEVGPNLDLFHTSRVPASVYSYAPTPARQTKAFLIPARVLRGQAKLTSQASKEGIQELAWCTREEVQQRVDAEYWEQALKQGELLSQ